MSNNHSAPTKMTVTTAITALPNYLLAFNLFDTKQLFLTCPFEDFEI